MCGICGIFDPRGADLAAVERMTRIMFHRGPDAGGTWSNPSGTLAFGNRRLAIIDLDPRSNMPLSFPERGLTITYNGEIYNHADIRKELEVLGHVFRTRSDTEVVLHAYDQWGYEAIHKFRGMFAFALWDEPRQLLWAARDRLGVKPFIYWLKGSSFAFASEIQQFAESGAFDLTDDFTALYDSLTYGYIPSPKTAYREIHKLEPGHYLVWQDGKLQDHRYWDVTDFCEHKIDRATAIEELRALLEESIALRLVSDVPVGSLLSGGIDSSCVSFYAQQQSDRPLRTFSVGFDERSELEYARIVAEQIKSEHIVKFYDVASAKDHFERWMFLYGEPNGDSSIYPTTLVSQMAREKVAVALSGDGGDEIFWGYERYLKFAGHNRKHEFPLRAAVRRLSQRYYPFEKRGRARSQMFVLDDFDLWCALLGGFPKADKRRLLDPEVMREFRDYDDFWAFRKHWKAGLPLATRLQYLDLKTYLPDDILCKVDRASMAVSLELRDPLLDHKLVEFAFALPDDLRSDGKTLKLLFKQSMQGILPEAILSRSKQGFSIPWTTWVKSMPDFARQRGDGNFFKRGLELPPNYMVLVVQKWLATRAAH